MPRSNIIDFPFDRQLRAEAVAFAERYGKNPYSDFLLKQRRRPERDQAATIGRLMGVRVRASDGSIQPRQTKVERAAAKKAKHYQQAESDYIDQIVRLRCALANLAKNTSDPADVIAYMDPLFGDVEVIRDQLAHAVHWITRFSEEWDHEQETRGGPRQV